MDSLTLHGVSDVLSTEHLKYSVALKSAGEAFHDIEEILKSREYREKIDWKKEDEDNEGTVVYTKKTDSGKMVIVQAEWPADADIIMKETWEGVEGLSSWNTNIVNARRIATPTEHFDICHYVYADLFVITGREVVCSRIFRKTEDGYIIGSKSVVLDECPERKDKVRMELILGGARFRPHPTKPDWSLVECVMHGDPKGMIPKGLVNQVIGKVSLKDANCNRQHYTELARKTKNLK